MGISRLPGFAGFERPQDNFYRLPYSDALDWFQFWRTVRADQVRRSVLAPIKVAEYVIKHTWGQLEFHNPVAISISNFEHGGRYRYLTDAGTGLQRRPIIEAIRFCQQIGLLELRTDASKTAHTDRRFRIRLRGDQLPENEAHEPVQTLAAFGGFPHPDQNYFIVPKQWTNLTSEITSEVLILAVEYLFCHCWNWSRERRAETVWLSVDDVVDGRRYRDKKRPDGAADRYDTGIGFTHESVRAACHLAVASGLFVRRRIHEAGGQLGDEQFTLRAIGMPQGQGYRHYSHSVEFGDLSGLFDGGAEPNLTSSPEIRLNTPVSPQDTPASRLNTPAPRQGAPEARNTAPGLRADAPATRLDTPLYVPASEPAFSRPDLSPVSDPATTPATAQLRQDLQQTQQAETGAVGVEWAPLDSSEEIADCVKVAASGSRGQQSTAIERLCRAPIDRSAALAFVSQWLMQNKVFESTRRNIVASHPEPAVLVRAIVEFERTERPGAALQAFEGESEQRAWGRKVGGTFKIASRVVALDTALRDHVRQLAAAASVSAVQTRQANRRLTRDQVIMIDALRWQGFSSNDARALAVAYHDAFEALALPRLIGWIDYVSTESGIHTPQAFLRKRLDQLDKPPAGSADGPATHFWLWRESALDAHPEPLENPAIDYALYQSRQAQIQRAKAALAEVQQTADEAAPSDEREQPVAKPTHSQDDASSHALTAFFAPECRRALDLVEMRDWRARIYAACARDEAWRALFDRMRVTAVDKSLQAARIVIADATTIDAGRCAVVDLPRINEVCEIALAIDATQLSDEHFELLALWREAVREYRAQFGALSNVPVSADTRVPVQFLWPTRIDDTVIEMPMLAPESANAPAHAWLSARLSDLAERAVSVTVSE